MYRMKRGQPDLRWEFIKENKKVRKQEKRTRPIRTIKKKRKQELDQESDQEKKSFSWSFSCFLDLFLGRVLVFFFS